MADRKKQDGHAQGNPLTEWVAAGVGLVLLVGAVGYIVYDSWRSGESPPAFVVTVESVTQVPSGYRVQFRAENVGATAAEGVIIQARSASADGREEISHTTLDYVPGGAARRGGLFFSSDPRGAELSIRALGYQQP